jgi:large conductance mechanosensitive channel
MVRGFRDFVTVAIGAAVYFFIVVSHDAYKERRGITPSTLACSECLTDIPEDAKRCAHCTQPQAAAAG